VTTRDEWLEVPIGPDADRWNTRRHARTALVVAHSVTALQRLLDVTDLFAGDQRVQTVFTQGPGIFSAGVRELLDGLGAAVVPWHQAVRTSFDVALASGYSGLAELRAPVVVLPHGAGYNKFVSSSTSATFRAEVPIYGISGQNLVRDGRVLPSTIVLAHDDERITLKNNCADALPAALVAGDPCLDRLTQSKGKRAEYRERLGVEAGRKLLVVSSTWGYDSLYGADSDVLDRLADEASSTELAVLVMLHPNVWFGHSPWQVRSWFKQYKNAGFHLLEPHLDWRSYLLCADWFIGDHGSISLYAATLEPAQLRTAFSLDSVVPGSALEMLHAAIPAVDPSVPLVEQLEANSSPAERSVRSSVVQRLTSEPGAAARHLRSAVYRHLNLDEPECPAMFDEVPPPLRTF
jgi:hypothetical protein